MFQAKDKMHQKKIKILYIIGTIDIGGAEGHLLEVVRRINRDKFEPIVCHFKENGELEDEFKKAGVKIKSINFEGLKGRYNPISLLKIAKNLFSLFRFIKEECPDIMHGYLFEAYIAGSICAKLAGVPIIVTSRRCMEDFRTSRLNGFMVFLERIVNNFTDLIIANSCAVKNDVLGVEKINDKKIIVVYNGIDLACINEEDEVVLRYKKSLGINQDEQIIGMVANFLPVKGHRDFLEAASTICKDTDKVKFVLIGDGPLRGEIEQSIKELGIEDKTILLGRRRNVFDILSILDVFVLSSYGEGFSNAILEAQAIGVPVVVTDVGGNREAIADGETGFLVPAHSPARLTEAILKIIGNLILKRKMSEAAKERIKKDFDLIRIIKEMEVTYDRLLTEKKKTAFKRQDIQERTKSSFGYQWTKFSNIVPEFRESFLEYIFPIGPEFFKDKLVFDMGCGFGRHIYYGAQFGPRLIVGMDFSQAIEAAGKNTKEFRNISLVQGNIYQVPFKREVFDFVYSLGVIHHLPNPQKGFEMLLSLLKKGGTFLIWVYSDERKIINLMLEIVRMISNKMPHRLLDKVCYVVALIDWCFFIKPYRLLKDSKSFRRIIESLAFSRVKVYARYPFEVCYADWFDRLSAPTRFYYNPKVLEVWAKDSGIKNFNISATGKYGWRMQGEK